MLSTVCSVHAPYEMSTAAQAMSSTSQPEANTTPVALQHSTAKHALLHWNRENRHFDLSAQDEKDPACEESLRWPAG